MSSKAEIEIAILDMSAKAESEGSALRGLAQAEKIERIVAKRIAAKQWRAETEKEVRFLLERSERSRKADLERYVREQYDAAGAGHAGRFQQ